MIRSDAIIRDLTRVNRPLQKHSAESLQLSTKDVPTDLSIRAYSRSISR